ncbi:MAG: hypothetical protein ACK4E4_02535 [Rhodocyclaceae bacterium]
MFIKIVTILLLLIVAASLLAPRSGVSGRRPHPRLRSLMLRLSFVLLGIAAAAAWVHFFLAS